MYRAYKVSRVVTRPLDSHTTKPTCQCVSRTESGFSAAANDAEVHVDGNGGHESGSSGQGVHVLFLLSTIDRGMP